MLGAPPLPPSALILVSTKLFVSHILTSFSQLLLCNDFYPFLNILNATVSDKLSFRQWQGYLRAVWSWRCQMASVVFSQRPPLQPPLLPKPCYVNPIQNHMTECCDLSPAGNAEQPSCLLTLFFLPASQLMAINYLEGTGKEGGAGELLSM